MTRAEIQERQRIMKEQGLKNPNTDSTMAFCFWLSELCLQVAEFNDTLHSTINSSNCPLYVQVEPGQYPITVDVKK